VKQASCKRRISAAACRYTWVHQKGEEQKKVVKYTVNSTLQIIFLCRICSQILVILQCEIKCKLIFYAASICNFSTFCCCEFAFGFNTEFYFLTTWWEYYSVFDEYRVSWVHAMLPIFLIMHFFVMFVKSIFIFTNVC